MGASLLWLSGFLLATVIAMYTFLKRKSVLSIISLTFLVTLGLFTALPSIFFYPFDNNLSDDQCIYLLMFIYFSGVFSAIGSLFVRRN